jgi:dihydrofolate synthase/folylpolyglutamate synthase
MQSPREIKSSLFSLVNKGIKYDLDRMRKAASILGNPQKSYRSIHVAGTNGKGSTCAYIESILRRAGYHTGLYASPHITNFEERFKIDGVDIDESAWFDVYKDQEEIINDLNLTFFEAATLMSFEIFNRAGVQYAVFETGMGGRLDATNIIAPEVSVITKLALDHKEYLGDALLSIAGEKLGIVKPGVPLVMLDTLDRTIKQLAIDKCKETGSKLTFAGDDMVGAVINTDSGVSFYSGGYLYDLSLAGAHQVQNALLAMTAVKRIVDFNHQAIYEGLKSASLPGRFQIIDIDGRAVVIDVGHNPDAAKALVNTLGIKFPDRRILFVIGIMKDKDIASTLEILAERASSFYFAKPKTDRAADPECLRASIAGKFDGRIIITQDISDALRIAFDDARKDDVVCVTGSFFTVSEALAALAHPHKISQ